MGYFEHVRDGLWLIFVTDQKERALESRQP
jgi:hypothetical protein